jgi:hypothetical protein
MLYEDLRNFFSDVFQNRGKDILDRSMKEIGILNFDYASPQQKSDFASHIRKNYLNFSALKNKYIYHKLSIILGLSTFSETRGDDLVEKEEEEESMVTIVQNALNSLWSMIERSYMEYGIIINIFWEKGVDAQLKGRDKKEIHDIIKKSLVTVNKNLSKAYSQLLYDLDLEKYQKTHKHSLFRIKLFKDMEFEEKSFVPDEKTKFLIEKVKLLKKSISETFGFLESLLMRSIDYELFLKIERKDDSNLITGLQAEITQHFNRLKKRYNEVFMDLTEKFS